MTHNPKNINADITDIWAKLDIKISSKDELKDILYNAIDKISEEPQRQYGFRTQNMFSYVAHALGKCSLIKQEDSGINYSLNTNLKIPDYKIILDTGEAFMVEVKNCNDNNITFKKEYINNLEEYAKLNKCPLKVAIYWNKIRHWALLPSEKFKYGKDAKCYIKLADSFYLDEMYKLGDFRVGTVAPLRLRLIPDKNKPINYNKDGHVGFTIGSVEIYSDSTLIADELEKNIAFQLMVFGSWDFTENFKIINGNLLYYEHIFSPYKEEEPLNHLGFEIMDSLSRIISEKYKFSTSSEKNLIKFKPSSEPENFKVLIPLDYKGKFLHLWRFIQEPNNDYTTIGSEDES